MLISFGGLRSRRSYFGSLSWAKVPGSGSDTAPPTAHPSSDWSLLATDVAPTLCTESNASCAAAVPMVSIASRTADGLG